MMLHICKYSIIVVAISLFLLIMSKAKPGTYYQKLRICEIEKLHISSNVHLINSKSIYLFYNTFFSTLTVPLAYTVRIMTTPPFSDLLIRTPEGA